jgi:hypothetical protein
MPARHPYEAHYPADLTSLSVLPLKRKLGIGRVVIADPNVAKDKRETWERDINRNLRACGCAESSVLLLAALVGYGAYLLWRWSAGGQIGWRHLGWALLILAIAAAVGKAVGLLRAEGRYRRLVRQIGREWSATPPKSDTISKCG